MLEEEGEEGNCGKEDDLSFLDLPNTTNEASLNMMNLHFDVLEATLKSIQTKSITPIVKEELKLKIQASRLAAGKEELPKPVFKEPQKYQLTAEEEEKRRVKRERNRIAAEKCRKKKKMVGANNSQELQDLNKRNVQLKGQVLSLETEIGKMRENLAAVGVDYIKVSQDFSDIPSTSTSPIQYSQITPCSPQQEFNFQAPSPSFTQVNNQVFPQATTPLSAQTPPPMFTQTSFSYENIEHLTQGSITFQFDPYMTPQWPPQLCVENQHQHQHLPESMTFGECYLDNEVDNLPNIDEINQYVAEESEAQVPGPQLDFTSEMPSFY